MIFKEIRLEKKRQSSLRKRKGASSFPKRGANGLSRPQYDKEIRDLRQWLGSHKERKELLTQGGGFGDREKKEKKRKGESDGQRESHCSPLQQTIKGNRIS